MDTLSQKTLDHEPSEQKIPDPTRLVNEISVLKNSTNRAFKQDKYALTIKKNEPKLLIHTALSAS
jgi:hypothetical protein